MCTPVHTVRTVCTPVHTGANRQYTEFPLLETTGSKDMAVPNQVSYLTLSKVINISVMPNINFFLERNGSPTKV